MMPAHSPVDVALAASPSLMTVSNNAVNYQFYDLGISTASTLTKAGSGTLEFTSPNNNFTGPVDIRAGVLVHRGGRQFWFLGNSDGHHNNGVFPTEHGSGGAAINAPISGSGTVEVSGAEGFWCSAARTPTPDSPPSAINVSSIIPPVRRWAMLRPVL